MNFSQAFINESKDILEKIDIDAIEHMAIGLQQLRSKNGRLFIIGVGGSAGHAGHAVNDFRKICRFEAYAPTDNVSELTARINDEGWESSFSEWLKGSRFNEKDGILIFSVGGGNKEKSVSVNIINALSYGKEKGGTLFSIVGRDGGFSAQVSDHCVIIPTVNPTHVTPHTEGMTALVWHLLVSHPALKVEKTKWESVDS
ncbi:SIS domain-containing protein [Curvivirga aplysinae]|uniref:SIS domain-containing protein n=1 Tax=Curvivirga aplysinae TaxID=2529852 RepID=UPI0012BCD575|nr:SIS domain-containing protein [Curvivirga aplysinae]MTI08921.1 SIS domain-containing protein [Curvivirga aplysinae]